MIPLGLRIDVDTFRGTRDGVPRLLELLAQHEVAATFFFTLGPDNMGRHLRRLADPRFAMKMLRSHAASLYGWDILFAGTFWPGRRIGTRLAAELRSAAETGHEVGLHAFDHHRWQAKANHMSAPELESELGRGVEAFKQVFGRRPDCSAAAGWVCNEQVLRAKEKFGFRYNSDSRGHTLFTPVINGQRCAPQVPTTLPTYDELIGRNGVSHANYNERLLERLRPDQLNVLTIHAEVEGISQAPLFDAFLHGCQARHIQPVPLGQLLDDGSDARRSDMAEDDIVQGSVPGRAGKLCWQRSALTL